MSVLLSHKEARTCFAVLLMSLGVMAFSGCDRGDPVTQATDRLQPLRVSEVREGPVVQGRRYLATVVPVDTVRVLAEVPGTVVELPVSPGEEASRGDLLVRLQADEMGARLARVRAEGARARQQRDFACDHAQTDRELAAGGVITLEQLDQSEANCAGADAALAAANAAGDEAGAASAKTVEPAPFEGRVLEHFVDVGQAVMPGTPLVLYGTRKIELLLRVPQSEITTGIEVGDAVVFGGGRGAVTEIGGQAKGPGALVDVRVSSPLGQGMIVGATVPAQVVVGEVVQATSVPVESVGHDDRGDYVLIIQGDRATRAPVTLGPRDGGWVAIQPAPPPGSRVVSRDVERVDLSSAVLAIEVGS